MAELKRSLQSFHNQVEAVKHIITSMITGSSEVQVALTDHHIQLQTLWSHMDGMEDCHKQNNIRLRGVPETIIKEELLPLVKQIFNTLLGKPAHRTSGTSDTVIVQHSHVLCRVQFFKCKEELLNKSTKSWPNRLKWCPNQFIWIYLGKLLPKADLYDQ